MRHGTIARFLTRWFVSGLGLWIAAGLLGDRIEYQEKIGVIVIAGLILAVINGLIKPLVIIFSLPAIVLSLGLFMIVVNGLMVLVASWLYPSLEVRNFWAAMLAGMVIGLVNYLVGVILRDKRTEAI